MNTEYAIEVRKTLTDYIRFYSEFLAFEQNKLEAVEQNKLELLDGLVKQEEVFLLKSRGMEQNRIKSQKEHGFADKRLRDLIEIAPDDMKEELLAKFTELNAIVVQLQRTNERCNVAIKARLQAIERAMDRIKAENNQKTYDDAANSKKKNGKAFFSDKV